MQEGAQGACTDIDSILWEPEEKRGWKKKVRINVLMAVLLRGCQGYSIFPCCGWSAGHLVSHMVILTMGTAASYGFYLTARACRALSPGKHWWASAEGRQLQRNKVWSWGRPHAPRRCTAGWGAGTPPPTLLAQPLSMCLCRVVVFQVGNDSVCTT